MIRITEQPSTHRNIEQMSVEEITARINDEDKSVALAVEKALPQLNTLINVILEKLTAGGHLFYVGAGSGGRLSVLDVIELPTTYGIEPGIIQSILAGGVEFLVDAREEEEDDTKAGWRMLTEKQVSVKDIVVGISASGTTPFVLEALKKCRQNNIVTGCIVSNPDSPIAAHALYAVEVITGPEFITGSTRMKCGTAQKMIFDIISTTTMSKMGRVMDNRMVHVKLMNKKLYERATNMLMETAGIADFHEANEILIKYGNVQKALDYLAQQKAVD